MASKTNRTMSLWSVVAIGIGSMVGAGIFALLGQAALVVGRETYLAFAIGGLIALLAGFAYAGLSARYPSDGGVVVFLNLVLPRRIAGGLALAYLANIAISTALIAKTFGHYAVGWTMPGASGSMADLIGSAVVIVLFLLTTAGGRAVGRVEEVLVAIKVTILLSFFAGGVWYLDFDAHNAHESSGLQAMIQAVGLTFFAYAGFGMMANAAGSVENPARTMRIVFPVAICATAVLYIGLSLLVLAAIPPAELKANADTAIATAAQPYFGRSGFVIMSIAALLATASTINANLYSGNEMARSLAEAKQLPARAGADVLGSGTLALLTGVMLVLVMTNSFGIATIANAAGAIFLLVYIAVFFVAWRLRAETGTHAWLILVGGLSMTGVFLAFLWQILTTQPWAFAIVFVTLAASILAQKRA